MRLFKLALVAFCLGCGSTTPVNFAGTYSVTIVSGANSCNLMNWTPGNSAGSIPVTITQDGSIAEFTVSGLAGAYLLLVLGTESFSGTVTGDTFTATYLGTKTFTQQTCMYSINVDLSATLTSNTQLNGTLTYTATTNGDPTCGSLNTCNATAAAPQQQTVVGVRTSP